MGTRVLAWAGVFALVAAAGEASLARDVEVTLRPEGSVPPSAAAFGQGGNLPRMTYRQADKAYTRTLAIDHRDPQTYDLALTYGGQTFVLPVRLHRNSQAIDMPVHFDGPANCLERLVEEAETPAQRGNIPQALRKYLLAAYLSEIDDEDARCRGNQPARLRKARIERGIQLATFRGSPFMPPENDESEWASILGEASAQAYIQQVKQAGAILLFEERDAALAARNYEAAAEVNAMLIESSTADAATAELYRDIGVTQRRLADDQAFINSRAVAMAGSSNEG